MHSAFRFHSEFAAISLLDTAKFIVLAHNIEHGVCTKVVVNEKEIINFEANRAKEEKKENVLGKESV